jgi:endonuclease/exonuclease/phosphatase family metal-dependent hydrolase
MNILKNKFSLLLLFTVLVGFNPLLAQQLRVASYNLRYDNPGDSLDNWKYRKDVMGKQILFHDFDIIGTQEGLHHQLNDLMDRLPNYDYIGVGRDDGKIEGEHSAIFYKTDMFELKDNGDFWLSEDTSQPNKGWDAVLPRICSWGKFQEKTSGLIFYLFNVHFDHVGTRARKESAKLILDKIKMIAGDSPTLLTGDFNVDQNSDSYLVINNSDILTDAYDKALLRYGPEGTFNGFKINAHSESRIDHIFVTDDFGVLKHGVLTDTYQTSEAELEELVNSGTYPQEIILYLNQARLPSDHYPILSVIEYKSNKANHEVE